MKRLRDENGHLLCECGICLKPPHGFGCVCPPAPQQKAHKGAGSVEAMKHIPKAAPAPPKPAPVRKAGPCTPAPRVEKNPLVVNLEILNARMAEAVELLKIIAGGKAKGG